MSYRFGWLGSLCMFAAMSAMLGLCSAGAQDQSTTGSETHLLRWEAQTGQSFSYMLSTSGNRGDSIAVRTETFTVEVAGVTADWIRLIARGEPVPEGAGLGFRFQRSYWPQFEYAVSPLGATTPVPGQPFPPFLNVPVFPEEEVGEGATWGGRIAVLNDPNVGMIPFEYQSTIASIADYDGELCAAIETTYQVALDEGARSLMPFLGLVEGDVPEEPGHGAPVGGVVEGSRAHQAGIEPGDLIIEAEGQRIRGWGGLEEILPFLVPEKPVEFVVGRGEETFETEFAPEGVPLAWVSATGGLRSTCYFSIDRGIPLKIDLTSEDLVFVLTNSEGQEETRPIDLHITLEFLY